MKKDIGEALQKRLKTLWLKRLYIKKLNSAAWKNVRWCSNKSFLFINIWLIGSGSQMVVSSLSHEADRAGALARLGVSYGLGKDDFILYINLCMNFNNLKIQICLQNIYATVSFLFTKDTFWKNDVLKSKIMCKVKNRKFHAMIESDFLGNYLNEFRFKNMLRITEI
jgi:hypothetical protein